MTSPYLPYILRDVVAEVNTVFSERVEDPFNVFFDWGLYVDVAKSIYKKENADSYPLIWLVTSSIEITRGRNAGNYGTASFDVIIAMPTSNEYTPAERTENVFLPRLYPIYDEFIKQLALSGSFSIKSQRSIEHRYKERPYWGGGISGTDNKNLFENFIDAIQVEGITVNLKNIKQEC